MRSPGVTLARKKVRRKQKDGTKHEHEYWYLRWPDSQGTFRYESIGRTDEITAKDAAALRRQKIIDLGIGAAPRDPSRITLAQFLEQDRESIKANVQPSTYRAHEMCSTHAINAIDGDKRLDRIGWSDVAKVKTWLTQDHVINEKTYGPASRATVRKTIVTMKAAWYRAKKRGIVAKNPWADERLAKVQSRQQRIFSAAEVEQIIEAAPNAWWRALIRLAFTTGLRVGELVNLTWDDINTEDRELAITAKRAGHFTVRKKRYPILEWSAKSHQERRVPLCDAAIAAVEPLRLRSGGSRYVFLSLERLQELDERRREGKLPEPYQWVNNVRRDFHRIQATARANLAKQRKVEIDKVDWRVGNLHDLRRSYGTLMARTVSMHELKALMGHSSITVTEQFYLGVGEDLGKRVRTALAKGA